MWDRTSLGSRAVVDDVEARSRSTATQLVRLDEIEAARRQLAGVSRVTPVERPAGLAALCGRPVGLKAEHHQRTGSFKVRGAYHLISTLPDGVDHVVAASAGNHAQGVALAASLLGRRATIFMPLATPLPKVQATRSYGADIRLGHEVVDDCIAEAARVRGRDRRRVGSAVRRPADHRRSGHGRVGDRRPGTRGRRPSSCRSVAAACSPARRPRSRPCGPTCGSSASRPPARRRWRRRSPRAASSRSTPFARSPTASR